jgi:electron transport complex protein RnfD
MTTEKNSNPELILSNPPHLRTDQSLRKIMWMVVIALLPATVYSVYLFGLKVLFPIIASIVAAVAAEALYQALMKKPVTVSDGSAVITGLLLAMNVPPDAPIWMIVIGSAFAIIIAKQLFGGLGFNIFNPALAARAFLIASWPVEMTAKWHKFSATNVFSIDLIRDNCLSQNAFEVVTQATPLAALKEAPALLKEMNTPISCFYDLIFSTASFKSLFIGNIGGCIGETSVLFLLIGGLFLLYKRVITWHIPVSFIGTVAVFMLMYYLLTDFPHPFKVVLYHVLSGGLFLGAIFMSTDMVTSPVTDKGMIIFGVGCGIITSVIRLWGGYPEGVSYSILLMNATVPLIDRYTKPRIFGESGNKE